MHQTGAASATGDWGVVWSKKGLTTAGHNGVYTLTKLKVDTSGEHHFAFTFNDYKGSGCSSSGYINFALYMSFKFSEYAEAHGLQFDVNEKVKETEKGGEGAVGDGDALVCWASGDISATLRAPGVQDSATANVPASYSDGPIIKGNDLQIAIIIESTGLYNDISHHSYTIRDRGNYSITVENMYVDTGNRDCLVLNLLFHINKTGNYNIIIDLTWDDNDIYSKTFIFNFNAISPEDAIGGVDKEPTYEFTDVTQNIDSFIPSSAIWGIILEGEVADKISVILTIVTSIGMIVSVIIPAVLGVKYMLGSIEEKAEYKQGIGTYLIGCCVLFGVCTIVKILMSVGTSINNSM